MSGRLHQILLEMGKVAVAYSGGVDSTLLLKLAVAAVGPENTLALTAHAQMHAEREIVLAKEFTADLGIPHIIVPMDAFSIEGFQANSPDRCYLCKKAVFSTLLVMAQEKGFPCLCDGGNIDDQGDYRPGLRAVAELGVRSPFMEAGIDKAEIRRLSRELSLPTAELPALACLATRIPYGTALTDESLRRIDRAEEALLKLGFSQLRVRDHDGAARIEVQADCLERAFSMRETIAKLLRECGFSYVALDLEGYRMGSLNEKLSLPK